MAAPPNPTAPWGWAVAAAASYAPWDRASLIRGMSDVWVISTMAFTSIKGLKADMAVNSHFYFTSLKLWKMGPLQFYLPVLLMIHTTPKQKRNFSFLWGIFKIISFIHFFPVGLGSYESIKRLKSKIGVAPFFKVHSGKITVWTETNLNKVINSHHPRQYRNTHIKYIPHA